MALDLRGRSLHLLRNEVVKTFLLLLDGDELSANRSELALSLLYQIRYFVITRAFFVRVVLWDGFQISLLEEWRIREVFFFGL